MNSEKTIEYLLPQVRAEFLARMTRGDGQLLQQVEGYVTQRLGKMLRPQLTLLAADTLGQSASRRTLLLATAVEMLHNASLLHDDVIDHSDTRRGRPSVNARWSIPVAVLVGDFLLAQVMHILHELNEPDTTQRIYQTVEAMVEAELLQQEVKNTSDLLPQTSYLKIIDGKTARLFATACALGNPEYEAFGLHFGRLFQLHDDIADGEAPSFAGELIRQEEEILQKLPRLAINI